MALDDVLLEVHRSYIAGNQKENYADALSDALGGNSAAIDIVRDYYTHPLRSFPLRPEQSQRTVYGAVTGSGIALFGMVTDNVLAVLGGMSLAGLCFGYHFLRDSTLLNTRRTFMNQQNQLHSLTE